jgi:hypothetical protein
MHEPPDGNSGPSAPVFVEDLFLTDAFLIKGRLPLKNKRLTNMLEDHARTFLPIHDATMVSLRGSEVIHTPTVMVNIKEVILAHELLEIAGDAVQRRLATSNKTVMIRAFYNGALQFELAGQIEPGAYDLQSTGRKHFIMQRPVFRGLNMQHPELALLSTLDYAIIRKDKMAYVYDFG